MVLQTNLINDLRYYKPGYTYSSLRQQINLKFSPQNVVLWHLLVVSWCLILNTGGACAELVDLTHDFDEKTIYWITEPTLNMTVTFNGTSPGNYWYQKDVLTAATHGGTHLDAPSHFALGGWSVTDIPLDRLVRKAVVIDISPDVNGDATRHLTLDDVREWETAHGSIPEGAILFVCTGWSKFWPDTIRYSGTDSSDASKLAFPSIDPRVAEWLVEKRNVVGVGIDTMSLDVPNTRPTTHITLMENNIYGLENVKNLELVPATGAVAFVMPMKLRYGSGAPCRIVVQIGVEHSASVALFVNSSLVIMLATIFLSLAFCRM